MGENLGSGGTSDRRWYSDIWTHYIVGGHFDDWHPDVFKDFDPEAIVESIASTGTQCYQLLLNDCAGSAYYVSEFEHTNVAFKGEDVFDVMLKGLKERGIRVVGYYSSLFDNRLFVNHPDWRIRDSQGRDSKQIPVYPTWGRRAGIVCVNSPYRDLMIKRLDTIGRKYDLDGLFLDMVSFWTPICHCQYCREKYRRDVGSDLPMEMDLNEPSYRRFSEWREESVYSFISEVSKGFKEHRPDAALLFNSPRPQLTLWYGTSLRTAELAEMMSGDPVQRDPSPAALVQACSIWDNMSPNRPVRMDIGRFHRGEGQHVGIRDHEVLSAAAFGCWAFGCSVLLIDFMNVDGSLYESAAQAVKNVFDRARPLQQFFGGDRLRSVAVYLSEDTRDYWNEAHSKEDALWYVSGVSGPFSVFQQEHIPADIITRLNLDELDQYALVCLPEMLCMREEEIAKLRAYVERGGTLIASGLTSLGNKWGDRQQNFALADVMGVDFLGETDNNETYTLVDRGLCMQAGIPDDMELKLERQAIVRARTGTEVLGEIVLPATNKENDGDRWISLTGTPPQIRTSYPAIVLNDFGKGRCCYFSGRVAAGTIREDFEIRENLFVEQQRLYATLGRMLLGEGIPIQVKAPWSIIATGLRQPDRSRVVVHLVNYQTKSPFIPVRGIEVKLRLGSGEEVGSVSSHPGDEALQFEQTADEVRFIAPEVEVYKAIAVEFATGSN